VSSGITVQSPIKVLTSISRQSVAPDAASATVEITTNVLWPYFIDNFTILTNNGAADSYTVSSVSRACPNDGTSSCTQVFRIVVVNGEACTINAIMGIDWTLYCQLNATGGEPAACAIQAGDRVTASLTLISENFCTVIATSLPATGTLASFGDASQTRAKTNFLVGQTLYYRSSIVSPNVTLTGATINSVKLTSPAQADVLLYSEGASSTEGTAGAFTLTTQGANFANFHFTLSAAFIDALADDSSRTYSTEVIVDVDFQNTITNKRGVMSIAFSSDLLNMPVGLAASFQAESTLDTSASALSAGAFTLGAAAIVSLL
jgi:hypothetical protein